MEGRRLKIISLCLLMEKWELSTKDPPLILLPAFQTWGDETELVWGLSYFPSAPGQTSAPKKTKMTPPDFSVTPCS